MFGSSSLNEGRLFLSTLRSWRDIVGNGIPDVSSLEYKILVFNLANSRLEQGKDSLRSIYIGDEVPESLGHIIRPFIKGEASLDETRHQLEDCLAKLREWMSELKRT